MEGKRFFFAGKTGVKTLRVNSDEVICFDKLGPRTFGIELEIETLASTRAQQVKEVVLNNQTPLLEFPDGDGESLLAPIKSVTQNGSGTLIVRIFADDQIIEHIPHIESSIKINRR